METFCRNFNLNRVGKFITLFCLFLLNDLPACISIKVTKKQEATKRNRRKDLFTTNLFNAGDNIQIY